MSKNARDKRPYVKPVTRIDLSGEHFTLRWILVVLLLAVGATCLVVGITSLMETEAGWTAVEVSSTEVNCSMDFQLYYELGASGESATVENKVLTTLYSAATEDAYLIFSAHSGKNGVNNVKYLNEHPNEIVTVHETLYDAFELIVQYDNRNIFMAPVNVEYNRIFSANSDVEAAGFDPAKNADVKAYTGELASYANDPEKINIELLGENQVRLNIAQDYLDFAQNEEIVTFVDFSWMTNAFIIDYIADVLVDSGYTNGYLSSYDGFTRNLDTRADTTYHLNIFDNLDGTVYVPAVMSYSEPISMVYLRSYPMSTEDKWHYYRFENGDVVSIFTDPADGMSKCSTNDLVSYSYASGCAEMLMKLIPVFIAEDFSVEELNVLANEGICSVWSEGRKICYNDEDLVLEIDEADSAYSKVYSGNP